MSLEAHALYRQLRGLPGASLEGVARLAGQPTGRTPGRRIGEEGRGSLQLRGLEPGKGGETGASRVRRRVPQAREGACVAQDGVVGEVGVRCALQHWVLVLVQHDAVYCEHGPWGTRRATQQESMGTKEVDDGGRATAADMLLRFTPRNAIEVALPGNARVVGGGLPLECSVGKCALDGPREECVRLKEVMENGAIPA